MTEKSRVSDNSMLAAQKELSARRKSILAKQNAERKAMEKRHELEINALNRRFGNIEIDISGDKKLH